CCAAAGLLSAMTLRSNVNITSQTALMGLLRFIAFLLSFERVQPPTRNVQTQRRAQRRSALCASPVHEAIGRWSTVSKPTAIAARLIGCRSQAGAPLRGAHGRHAKFVSDCYWPA